MRPNANFSAPRDSLRVASRRPERKSDRTLDEDFANCCETVERGGESGIHGHLHDNFDNLLRRTPDVQSRVDMDPKLRTRVTHRRQGTHHCELTLPKPQSRSRVDVPEGEFDQVRGELWERFR